MLKEGWPKYLVRLIEGALEVRFGSSNPDSIKQETQRARGSLTLKGFEKEVEVDGKTR
jgi:polyisoprenoid-binding protein YceI